MTSKEKTLAHLNSLCKNTLMETLDIKYIDFGNDYLVATMPVTSKVYQPDGILNGGASMALAESVGSPASMLAVDPEKFMVRGIAFTANHVRSVKSGKITATATIIHKGRTTHLIEIKITDDLGKLVSHCKLTNIILPKK
ncbi:MAG: PaaI family thioesterase [Lutibacter sp.]|uniref:PaaI family thioesterase n=1 Tax=Lutibacter sp. TaxID=1925666 RepID=UPI00299ED095|nr:PaaI family thioesterase [Lutibacter sp.]MDX1828401.1 PaaI family thioesterase [Lutibacter sp.]